MNNDDKNDLINILKEVLGDYRNINPNKYQISFDCPTCSYDIKGLDKGDGKGNLEINYGSGVYKCWVCNQTHDTHGTIYKLVRKFGTKKQLKKYNLIKPDNFEFIKREKSHINLKLPIETIIFKKATEEQKKSYHYKKALEYLIERKITIEMINKFNIGYCFEGDFKNRIIIPSYDIDGYLNFFIARAFYSYSKFKYKNPGIPKDDVIWNEYNIDWDEDIYLVEGVFDSLFINNSIPLLGKFLSTSMFNKLYENVNNNIIIIFDPDAREDAEKLYHRLNCGKLMGRISIVYLEGNNDVADIEGKINDYKKIKLD